METSKSIYPNIPRLNDYSSLYCEIAMQNYALAKMCFKKIEEGNYDITLSDTQKEMFKCCIATVVFSAMSVESFFNNYAASCLGDDNFYDNFDSLSLISKFQLISKFILKAQVDKSQSYYSYLVLLNRIRNNYVHNKSVTSVISCNTEEELKAFQKIWGSKEFDWENPTLNEEAIKTEFLNTQNAIRAIREIAYFFDMNDDSVYAVNRLFHTATIDRAPDWIPKYIRDTVKEFNIKAVNK